MYQSVRGWKPVKNSIIQLPNGERIDLRKAQVGTIRRQKRAGVNKYGARSAVYNGRTYHSTAEARYARELDMRVQGKLIKSWVPQVRCPLIVNGKKIATYILDFLVTHHDGTLEYIEVKGMMTDVASIKIKLFEALYLDDRNDKVKFTLVRV